MIKGQQVFIEHFADFQDCYVVIGGLAVDVHMTDQAIPFRVTKDFDIIILLEALRPEFFDHFWAFIKAGAYERKEVGKAPRNYYRFIKPGNDEYPHQIELFCRLPDVIPEIKDHQLVPIPADEDISSLSAILMDDDYYELTKTNTSIIDGLRIATEPLLICLKIKAFLDLSSRKENGEKVDSKNIRKHRNDVFRLGVTLTGEESMVIPESIDQDVNQFYEVLKKDPPEIKHLLKHMGIDINIEVDEIIKVIQSIFTKS